MIDDPNKQIISMTELQKLSLKKLRKKKLPLYVMDRKSKKKIFMITVPGKADTPAGAAVPDYRGMGLLWDRADLTNEGYHRRLKDGNHPENPWAVTRLLERARSDWVKSLITLDELKKFFPRVRLRPPYQEAWSRAIHYWTQTP